jgi:dihydrofolate reductase
MTKVQYYTAASLDGFIADEHGSLDWLFEVPHDEGGTWDSFIAGVGPMVMGATTYRWSFDRHDYGTNPGQWREFYDDRPCWVFTHHDLPPIPGVDIRFVSGEVRPVYDEIHVHVTPVVLGAGAPLHPRRLTSSRLRFREGALHGQRLDVVLDVRPRD